MVSSENTTTSITNTNSLFSKSSFSESPKIKYQIKSNYNPNFIEVISDLLTEICEEENDIMDNSNQILKPFLSKKIPSVSIFKYLKRLSNYNKMNGSTLILMLIYIDKVCEKYNFKLNFFIVHKIILASLICATKFNEDFYYSMEYYSKSGGVKKQEIINLEYEFLVMMNFSLFVENDLYEKYEKCLINCDDECDNNDKNNNEDDEEEKYDGNVNDEGD